MDGTESSRKRRSSKKHSPGLTSEEGMDYYDEMGGGSSSDEGDEALLDKDLQDKLEKIKQNLKDTTNNTLGLSQIP
jgi:hypothetical protein